jgi:oligogalacturonide transporter
MKKPERPGYLSMYAYGMADIYGGGAFIVISTFFTVFLTKSLGMSPALAGTIPLIGKVWDAITDPIMGNITDRTKSRMGPKRFYLLIGSFISAVTFVCLWVEYSGGTVLRQYVFYVVMYMLFSTGFTIVMVPYNALLPDMVDDYVVRGKFTGIRMIFSTLGAIIAGLIPTIMIQNNTDPTQYFRVAILFAVIFTVSILITFFGTWENAKGVKKEPFIQSTIESFTVYRSRTYRMFILIFLCGQGAADFVTGLAVYYVDDVLNAYQNGYFTYIMAALMISQLLGMAVFGPIMSHPSKKMAIMIGAPVRLIGIAGLYLFSHEGASLLPILALTALVGFGNAGSLTGIFAVMADMTDVDELITSVRRPGVVSSMATFIRKVSSGLSAALIGFLLAAVGYDEVLASAGVRQSAFTQRGIALIFVLAPAILTALLIVVNLFFPITGREFDMVQKDIARRRGSEDAVVTDAEKEALQKVTGFAYDALWNPQNAGLRR